MMGHKTVEDQHCQKTFCCFSSQCKHTLESFAATDSTSKLWSALASAEQCKAAAQVLRRELICLQQ